MSLLQQRRTVQIALAVLVGAASNALAQEPPKPGSAATAPDTGQMAPDFTLPGATRFGLLKDHDQAEQLPRPNGRARLLPEGEDQRLNGSNGGVP